MDTEGVHAESVSTGQVQTSRGGIRIGSWVRLWETQREGFRLCYGFVSCAWEISVVM